MAKERKNRASFKYQKVRGNGPKRTEVPATHKYGWIYTTDPATWSRETLNQPGILYGGLTAATRAICNKLLKAELVPVKLFADMFGAGAPDIPAEMKAMFVAHAAASGTALQQDLTSAFTLSEAHFRDVPDVVEDDDEDETDEEKAVKLALKIDALPPDEKAEIMQEMRTMVEEKKKQQQ